MYPDESWALAVDSRFFSQSIHLHQWLGEGRVIRTATKRYEMRLLRTPLNTFDHKEPLISALNLCRANVTDQKS
jgi:hypothetical protein